MCIEKTLIDCGTPVESPIRANTISAVTIGGFIFPAVSIAVMRKTKFQFAVQIHKGTYTTVYGSQANTTRGFPQPRF